MLKKYLPKNKSKLEINHGVWGRNWMRSQSCCRLNYVVSYNQTRCSEGVKTGMYRVRLTSCKAFLVFLLVVPILFSLLFFSLSEKKYELISKSRYDSVESSAVEKVVPVVPKVAVLMVGDIRDLVFDQRIMMLYHEHMIKVYGRQNLFIFLHISLQLRNGKSAELHELQVCSSASILNLIF